MEQSAPIKPTPALLSLAAMLGLIAFTWSYIAIQWCLPYYNPQDLAVLRLLCAAVAMSLVFARQMKQSTKMSAKDCLFFILLGAELALVVVCIHWSSNFIQPAMVSFLAGLPPVFVIILSFVFRGEVISKVKMLGIVLCFICAGSLLLIHLDEVDFNKGIWVALSASLVYATFLMTQKKLSRQYHFSVIGTWALVLAALWLIPCLPGAAKQFMLAPAKINVIMLSTGVFSLAVGTLSWAYVLSHSSVIRVASFSYAVPFLTSLGAWWLMGKVSPWYDWLACVLMVVGVVVVQTCRKDFLPGSVSVRHEEKNYPKT